MSRTAKWEHRSDSFHTNHREERKARPAGRLDAVVDEELEAVEPDYEPDYDHEQADRAADRYERTVLGRDFREDGR